MFNMERIGLKISELRKAKNMTQMDLADRMNISFQAVSGWERGISMPDISKLPELASLFGVSIDDLLGEKSALIDNAANGKLDEYLSDNTVTVEELREAAPILAPKQVDAATEKTTVKSLREIEDLLPFISCDIVNALAWKAVEAGDYHNLAEAAPFISQNVRDNIARKMIGEGKKSMTSRHLSAATFSPSSRRSAIGSAACRHSTISCPFSRGSNFKKSRRRNIGTEDSAILNISRRF